MMKHRPKRAMNSVFVGDHPTICACSVEKLGLDGDCSVHRSKSAIKPELCALLRRKIRAIGMMESQRAHRRLGLHHVALRQLHTDLFRMQQLPDALLARHVSTRGIAEAVA